MKKKKILWVEDDSDILAAIVPMLRKEGWEVHTADSAAAGCFMAERIKPDLIVMDIIMDRIHGFFAIEHIKLQADLVSVPIIIFSSVTHRWKETTATRRDVLETEAEEFIDKSLGPKALIAAIHKYLDD